MRCPCERDILKHSIYYNLSKGHIQDEYPCHHKAVPGGLHRKHINCFIWGVPLGIYRGNQTAPFLGKLTLQ